MIEHIGRICVCLFQRIRVFIQRGFDMTILSNPNAKPDYNRVKAAVEDLHNTFGILRPPINPVQLAHELGVGVYFVEFQEAMKKVSGFYDPDNNSIYVNKDEYPLRQTFTIAHELGHHVLHKEWAKTTEYRVLLRADNNNGDVHEIEANAFAANLLVPRFLLSQFYQNMNCEELSKLFAVSVPVIKNRMSQEYGF